MFVILKNHLKYRRRERIESNGENVHRSVAPRRGGAAVDVALKILEKARVWSYPRWVEKRIGARISAVNVSVRVSVLLSSRGYGTLD